VAQACIEVVRLFGYPVRQADAVIEFSIGGRATKKAQSVIADDLPAHASSAAFGSLGAPGSFGAVLLSRDLGGNVVGRLAEGLEAY
jgi:hypothetical protein